MNIEERMAFLGVHQLEGFIGELYQALLVEALKCEGIG